MTTRYVGIGGNDGNDGLSWANRKLTLNGVEDTPVEAGDTVYVGPGTYREMLTCDVSGSSGSPITYIGDYTGANTDGIGGIVRISASDNDTSFARTNCITGGDTRDYRSFYGFLLHGGSQRAIDQKGFGSYSRLDSCYIDVSLSNGITINPGTNTVINNCFFYGARANANKFIEYYASSLSDYAATVTNCIFSGFEKAISSTNVGGITIKNCIFYHCDNAFTTALSATDYPSYMYNCIIQGGYVGLGTGATGVLVEDYNLINSRTARSNVAVGANSVAYAPLFDSRWFFEAINGGTLLTPFDLASYSELIDVAGTSPTTADMRGTTVQGTQREWGALEYDSTLDIEAGTGGGGTTIRNVVIPMFIRNRR